jgi:hypothetical protein
MWKEAVVAYFKVLSLHSSGETEHKKQSKTIGSLAEIRAEDFTNASKSQVCVRVRARRVVADQARGPALVQLYAHRYVTEDGSAPSSAVQFSLTLMDNFPFWATIHPS